MSYAEFLNISLQIASRIALEYFGKVSGTVKEGDNNQVLTDADIAIGKHLVAAVQDAYPDHNIIDEEAGVIDNGSKYTWVIDPIDGTANFAAGTPDYGIMIGLLEGGTPIAGGIAAPAQGKLYIAEKGKGATCNGRPIQVTAESKLINILLSFGIDGYQDKPERTRRESAVFPELVLAVRNIRASGCEAIDNMYIAEGSYGGRVNFSAKIWDNVAPEIICEEAGALWTDMHGQPLDYSDPLSKAGQNFAFCVASPVLHEQLIAILKGHI